MILQIKIVSTIYSQEGYEGHTKGVCTQDNWQFVVLKTLLSGKTKFLRTVWLWLYPNQLSTDKGMRRGCMKREELVLDERLVH